MNLRFRRVIESDLGFVYDSLIQSFRKSWWAGPYPLPVLLTAIRRALDLWRERPALEFWCAVKSDDDNYIVGWIAWEPGGHHNHHRATCPAPVLLWVHVKELYRRGAVVGVPVATALLRHVGLDPHLPFCYPLKPHGVGEVVLTEKWHGGRAKPETYKFPPIAAGEETRK